jgi:hypothetical protein
VPEVAAVTGHSIAHGARMMDTYIQRNYSMAQSAQAKRCKNRKGPKV